MRTPALLLAGAFVCALALPATTGAQQEGRPCLVEFRGVVRGGVVTTRTQMNTQPGGGRHTYVGGGVDATCRGQGNRLLADSAEHYEDRGELILIRRVRYSESRVTMQSDRMVYYTNEDRLLATGNVRGKTNGGTRFSGPEMEYFRAKPGVRPTPRWRAPGRPFVRMAPTDSGRRPERLDAATAVAPSSGVAVAPPGARGDSVDLTADIVISENDSLVWASGDVIMERDDMKATGDSATLDEGIGFARLLKTPRIEGRGKRPFTMEGVEIDLWSREQKLERVRSSGEAKVTSDSLDLAGDTIDLRFADQLMQRVYAWGKRAMAETPSNRMEADSLDILMPGQKLLELHAIGKASAWTMPDTAKLFSSEPDWISGDTLLALFDTVAIPGDTATRTRMRQVTATGNARSLYQMAPSSGVKGPPNLSYNRGPEIIVSFKEGAVDHVSVKGGASGIFLEPTPADTSRPPKSTADPRRP